MLQSPLLFPEQQPVGSICSSILLISRFSTVIYLLIELLSSKFLGSSYVCIIEWRTGFASLSFAARIDLLSPYERNDIERMLPRRS